MNGGDFTMLLFIIVLWIYALTADFECETKPISDRPNAGYPIMMIPAGR